ncbi:hypothetical protein TNCV_574021 [Trichonephila clavipes]|nr:hypothetical protein TNCV_574021 [Trichonephila clavipes]
MRVNENYTFEGAVDRCGQRPFVCPLCFLFTRCPGAGFTKFSVGVGRRERKELTALKQGAIREVYPPPLAGRKKIPPA